MYQPLSSLKKNCTAIYSSLHFLLISWVNIQCDDAFEASFVCQKKSSPHYNPSAWSLYAVNNTCDDGWTLLESTRECILLLTPNQDISFSDAHRKCREEKSSVISLNPVYRKQLTKHNVFMLRMMKRIVFLNFREEYDGGVANMSDIYNRVFGLSLEKDEPVSNLLVVLSLGMADEGKISRPLDHIKLFTTMNYHCGLVEYLYNLQGLYFQKYPLKKFSGVGMLNTVHVRIK